MQILVRPWRARPLPWKWRAATLSTMWRPKSRTRKVDLCILSRSCPFFKSFFFSVTIDTHIYGKQATFGVTKVSVSCLWFLVGISAESTLHLVLQLQRGNHWALIDGFGKEVQPGEDDMPQVGLLVFFPSIKVESIYSSELHFCLNVRVPADWIPMEVH